jgi:hypothetical protein
VATFGQTFRQSFPQTFSQSRLDGVSGVSPAEGPLVATVSDSNPDQLDTITFTATPTVSGSATYQWYRRRLNNTARAIAGATSATYEREIEWYDHNRVFFCRMTTSEGTVDSDDITITVEEAPTISTHDFYIATTGNDGTGDGSSGNPWATLAPIESYMNSDSRSGQTIRVSIAAGAYSETGYNTLRFYTTPAKLYLDFASGCTITKGAGGPESCLQALGNIELYVISRGTGSNRLTVSGFTTTSGNAYGFHNTAKMYLWNCIGTGCVDGFTGHNTGYGKAINCSFSANTKGQVVHDTSAVVCDVIRSTITANASASTSITGNTGNTSFYDCEVTGLASAVVQRQFGGLRVVRCKLGLTDPVTLISGAEDSYINAAGDYTNIPGVSFVRCYGKFSQRVRGLTSAARTTFDRCALTGPASGTDGAAFANFYSGSTWDGNPITIKNTIVRGYTTAFGGGFGAEQITAWNANSDVTNCCLFGNTTNINASLNAAVNSIAGDPEMGSYTGSTDQSLYAVAADSSCVGAGVGGSNIGFTLEDIYLWAE